MNDNHDGTVSYEATNDTVNGAPVSKFRPPNNMDVSIDFITLDSDSDSEISVGVPENEFKTEDEVEDQTETCKEPDSVSGLFSTECKEQTASSWNLDIKAIPDEVVVEEDDSFVDQDCVYVEDDDDDDDDDDNALWVELV